MVCKICFCRTDLNEAGDVSLVTNNRVFHATAAVLANIYTVVAGSAVCYWVNLPMMSVWLACKHTQAAAHAQARGLSALNY